MSKADHFLWNERYRPSTVKECILPDKLKKEFQSYVDNGKIPNVIFSGGPGVGKTTVAKAMINELDADVYLVNASLHGNIDTLRNEIMQFASSVSINGGRKYVLLDEADNTTVAFQQGLRAFIEEFSSVTGFILTCNYKSRLIEPLQSRCPVIDFNFPKEEQKVLITELAKRVASILKDNSVPFEKEALVAAVRRWFPDMRLLLGELQKYAQGAGTIDAGILLNFAESRLESLLSAMKDKDFTKVRKWVTENSDIDSATLFSKIYEKFTTCLSPSALPVAVIILADYQHKSAFVVDQDINTCAAMAELMSEITWQ